MKPNQLDPFQTPFMRSPNALRLAQHKANNTLESSYFCKRLYTPPRGMMIKRGYSGGAIGKSGEGVFSLWLLLWVPLCIFLSVHFIKMLDMPSVAPRM